MLYAQPPVTQDANVATDGAMVTGVVEAVSQGKKVVESIEGLASPRGSANATVDVSLTDAHVSMSVGARGVNGVGGDTLSAQPPILVSVDDHQQQQVKAGDHRDVSEVPEVRVQVV